jgi:DNA-directed RNA polymerase subunit M/transcription elongation factor TFIIS
MADDRFKFSCECGQHLVARPSMAGTTVKCPACLREIRIPRSGESIDETQYAKADRYPVECGCGERMMVKAQAAGRRIHCPTCAKVIRIPSLDVLQGKRTPSLETERMLREELHTEDLLLLVDDEEGPGDELS